MHLYVNQDGKTIMDWEGRNPEEFEDSITHLIVSLLEKQRECKYIFKEEEKKHPGGCKEKNYQSHYSTDRQEKPERN